MPWGKATMKLIVPFVAAMTLLSGTATAQQPRYSSDWGRKGQTAETIDPGDATLHRLTQELKKLVDEAAREHAADPRFLGDLRELARRYEWEWPVRLVHDDFADGDWSRNPAWSAWGSELRVDRWRGVTMRVAQLAPTASPTQEGQGNNKDLTGALVGTFLNQLSRPDSDESNSSQQPVPTPAEAGLKLGVAVPQAFAIRVVLTSETRGQGRFEFGVFKGQAGAGYRLAYNAGARPSFELLRASRRGTAVIDAVDGPVRMEDGKRHLLQMTRGSMGDIAFTLDGKELVRTQDRAFRGAFDGVSLVDKGGDVTIRSVDVYGAK